EYDDVILIGRSLGSGIAVQLAATLSVDQVVLITPYDSIQSVAQGRYPIVPVRLLLRDKFQSDLYAPQIDIPTLILIAETDRVIPHRHTEVLIDSFQAGVTSVSTVPATNHNSIWVSDRAMGEIVEFLNH
ncbi:MAG: hypothetical protein MJA83_05980, partial [Gammaproteobacteria bacterium]|nr:hypothetical protein [Gammaproteobacteria bacterium]